MCRTHEFETCVLKCFHRIQEMFSGKSCCKHMCQTHVCPTHWPSSVRNMHRTHVLDKCVAHMCAPYMCGPLSDTRVGHMYSGTCVLMCSVLYHCFQGDNPFNTRQSFYQSCGQGYRDLDSPVEDIYQETRLKTVR